MERDASSFRSPRRAQIIAAALITALSSSPAFAASPEADAQIDRGIKLRTQQRDEEALAAFEAAYKLEPSARALAQRGLAEHALGRWMAAEEHLRAALEQGSDPWIRRQRAPLEESLATVARHLGFVRVEANVSGAELFIDGAPVARLPMDRPIRWAVGSAVLEVRAPGYFSSRRQRSVEAGQTVRESFALVAETARAPALVLSLSSTRAFERIAALSPSHPIPMTPARQSRSNTLAYIVGGTGVAATATGLIFGGLAWSSSGDVSAACKNDGYCGNDHGPLSTAHRDATISTVFVGVGVVALAVSTWMFLRNPSADAPAPRLSVSRGAPPAYPIATW